jgi:hypothetical protein
MGRRRKGDRLPPFVALPWDLLNSKAYKELPPSAAKALPYFLGKIKKPFNDPEKYNMEFTFSYPEGLRLGFSHTTFAKIIRDLEKFGFIDWVAQGGLRGKGRGYNRFKLSRGWENYKFQENEKKLPARRLAAKKDRIAIINERMAMLRQDLSDMNRTGEAASTLRGQTVPGNK